MRAASKPPEATMRTAPCPALSSASAMMWNALRTAGVTTPVPGYGRLLSLSVPGSSPVVGKLIRELALRSSSGASIVAIERQGESLINPGPDEELRADDRLLLLGAQEQLNRAGKYLEQLGLVPAGSHQPSAISF
ncbi:MAG: hypothetical protein EBU23_17415 [Mycobacteriaceae bacterium]|nr:hypothetical protein [Mycobacteriaceae bacterium]